MIKSVLIMVFYMVLIVLGVVRFKHFRQCVEKIIAYKIRGDISQYVSYKDAVNDFFWVIFYVIIYWVLLCVIVGTIGVLIYVY